MTNIENKVYQTIIDHYGLVPFEQTLLTKSLIHATVLECARLVDSFPGIPNDKIAQYLRNILK